jgi:antitoxin (DNA-binding transcriptional repressor) of toxin-antitoxin stability system
MTTVTLEEAQARLPDLIERLAPGSEVVITRNQQPIARLRAEEKPKRKPRRAGNCRGKGVCLLFGKLDNFRVCLFSQNGRRLEWRTNGALRGTWSQRWPQSTWLPHFNNMEIAVGTAVTGGPPHRSVREGFPHTALAVSRARKRSVG